MTASQSAAPHSQRRTCGVSQPVATRKEFAASASAAEPTALPVRTLKHGLLRGHSRNLAQPSLPRYRTAAPLLRAASALFRRRQYAESTIRTITIATKTPIAMRVPVRLLILRFCPICSVHSGDIPARWPSRGVGRAGAYPGLPATRDRVATLGACSGGHGFRSRSASCLRSTAHSSPGW
jgi:hypothetical protein